MTEIIRNSEQDYAGKFIPDPFNTMGTGLLRVLSKELSSGISGNYWRIIRVHTECDVETPYCSIILGLWVNRQTRLDGKSLLSSETVRMNLVDIDSTFSYDFRACLYNALKTLPEWADAIDVIEVDGA